MNTYAIRYSVGNRYPIERVKADTPAEAIKRCRHKNIDEIYLVTVDADGRERWVEC